MRKVRTCISLFGLIFIFCRIKLISGRLTCFDMKSILPWVFGLATFSCEVPNSYTIWLGFWFVFDCLWYNSFVTDQCQFILQRLCLGYKGRVYKFYDCRQRLMPQQTAVWDLCSCVKFSWLPMHDYEVHSHITNSIQDVSIHVDSRVGPTKLTWSSY